jgi:hypothetical protein
MRIGDSFLPNWHDPPNRVICHVDSLWNERLQFKGPKMTGEDYAKALAELELSHVEAAKQLGIGLRSSFRYASAQHVPRPVKLALEAMLKQRRRRKRRAT